VEQTVSTDVDRVERVYASQSANAPDQYRALSSAAVAAFVFGLLSLTALMDYWLVVVPIVGIIWGLIALRQVRARSAELTGRGLALCGLALSSVLVFAGPARVYYGEISFLRPDESLISYEELQPSPNVVGELVPQSALNLEGKKVGIKGFIYAGSQTDKIKKFVLVRDAGTCCFGTNPKITDRIVVDLVAPEGVYTKQVVRVAGVFHVNPDQAPGVGVAYYHLDQAELR
jgi:Domain of unknown function (DUF4190)